MLRSCVVTVSAIALAVGVAACSSDDGDSSSTATTSASAATDATTTAPDGDGAPAAEPSPQQLQDQLTRLFDPTVPAPDKQVLIEDGDGRAALLEQFNGVLAGYPLTATVTTVTVVDDDTVSTDADIAGPHGGAPVPVTFDYDAGTWRLSDDSTCLIFGLGRIACT
jgi:ABC-type phosphate/phosphonate transport system substrate-binding protein